MAILPRCSALDLHVDVIHRLVGFPRGSLAARSGSPCHCAHIIVNLSSFAKQDTSLESSAVSSDRRLQPRNVALIAREPSARCGDECCRGQRLLDQLRLGRMQIAEEEREASSSRLAIANSFLGGTQRRTRKVGRRDFSIDPDPTGIALSFSRSLVAGDFQFRDHSAIIRRRSRARLRANLEQLATERERARFIPSSQHVTRYV